MAGLVDCGSSGGRSSSGLKIKNDVQAIQTSLNFNTKPLKVIH